jgi:hypothetical protein
LAHAKGDPVKSSYNRADYVARRRVVVQDWSNYLDGREAESANNVVTWKRA